MPPGVSGLVNLPAGAEKRDSFDPPAELENMTEYPEPHSTPMSKRSTVSMWVCT